jgi:microcystin-dependent protein
MQPDKYNVPYDDYIRRDPKDGGMKAKAPLGFTGQGCIWYASTAPAGWLLCQGQLVNKLDYPDLWLLLGDTWGTSSATQFYLPNMATRVPVGKHSSGTFATLNNSGGAETHTLSISEIPSHNHGMQASGSTTPGYAGIFRTNASDGANSWQTNYSGGSGSHNNLQPYRVVNFIIKT